MHIAPQIGTVKAVALTRVDVQKAHTAMTRKRDGKGGKYSRPLTRWSIALVCQLPNYW